ncbi:MAG: thiamine phosphate synthase [Acidobacteria bacterium]|nr:MAG: thiamine phosphate synthase [Acidobacteriota bacterium]
MTSLRRLYAISDASFGDPVRLAQALFDGGARLVQVRNKKASARSLFNQVESILKRAPADASVIVNDRVDVARITGAAGVHLGQSDIGVVEARRILGPDQIIGFSTHNLEQALAASKLPADYIAVGPIFPTSTKLNAEPVVGLEKLATICKAVQKPVVAIGGIRLENAAEVLAAGPHSIAVVSDLLSAADIQARVREWINQLCCF